MIYIVMLQVRLVLQNDCFKEKWAIQASQTIEGSIS